VAKGTRMVQQRVKLGMSPVHSPTAADLLLLWRGEGLPQTWQNINV
jgi:hypothetical protein